LCLKEFWLGQDGEENRFMDLNFIESLVAVTVYKFGIIKIIGQLCIYFKHCEM